MSVHVCVQVRTMTVPNSLTATALSTGTAFLGLSFVQSRPVPQIGSGGALTLDLWFRQSTTNNGKNPCALCVDKKSFLFFFWFFVRLFFCECTCNWERERKAVTKIADKSGHEKEKTIIKIKCINIFRLWLFFG